MHTYDLYRSEFRKGTLENEIKIVTNKNKVFGATSNPLTADEMLKSKTRFSAKRNERVQEMENLYNQGLPLNFEEMYGEEVSL